MAEVLRLKSKICNQQCGPLGAIMSTKADTDLKFVL